MMNGDVVVGYRSIGTWGLSVHEDLPMFCIQDVEKGETSLRLGYRTNMGRSLTH